MTTTQTRWDAYLAAKLRDDRTGSPAARAALRDAVLDMEGHGEFAHQNGIQKNG
jgi:hypothetical protein